jgi:hypothetical protein
MYIPPLKQLLPCLLGEFSFLFLLEKFLLETAEVSTVLTEELIFQFPVFCTRINFVNFDFPTAELLFRGSTSIFSFVAVAC